jgi:hypothetical protein
VEISTYAQIKPRNHSTGAVDKKKVPGDMVKSRKNARRLVVVP